MATILGLSIIISFVVAYFGLIFWIKKCRKVGLLWEDMNKFGKPKNVAASGGIIVLIAFSLGVLFYVAIRTFILKQTDSVDVQIFALLTTIIFLGLVGLVDDFLGWHHGGLSIKARILLAIVAAIPLMVINAGESAMAIPFLGTVNFGILYPLILIPLGIVATSTVYNFLAGFSGLEAGQGILVVGAMSYVSYLTGNNWLALIGLCMVAAIFGYWFFNKDPAKVFPGDSMTYAVGGLVGAMAIIGNFEKIAIIIFIPYIIEMVLKTWGRFDLHIGKFPQSFGIPQKDGSLLLPYKKVYGLTHFSILALSKVKKKVYLNDVVYFVHLIQIVFIALAFLFL